MSESEAEQSGPITMPCLGRPFQLGMLYDCRNDSLVAGPSLWKKETIKAATSVVTKEYSAVDFIVEDNLDSKAVGINANASIKLSFLAGLLQVSGSARFLHDYKKSKKQQRMVLHFNSTSSFHQLYASRDDVVREYYARSSKIPATHVVTSILYGADAYFVFDYDMSSEDEVVDVQGRLSASLNFLVTASGQASGRYKSEERKLTEKLKCTFHGDVVLNRLPEKFDEAVKAYGNLTKLIKDSKVAIAKTAWLLPLTAFDSNAPKFINSISNALSARAQKAMEDFELVKVAATDLLSLLVNLSVDCQPDSDSTASDGIDGSLNLLLDYVRLQVKKFLSLVNSKAIDLLSAVRLLLPKLRRGTAASSDELERLINTSTAPPYAIEDLMDWLDSKENEANTLKDILKLIKDEKSVKSVHQQWALNEIILNCDDKVLVVLTLNIPMTDSYINWMETEESSRNSKKVRWFEDPLSIIDLRDKICSLEGFANAQKGIEGYPNTQKKPVKCIITHSEGGASDHTNAATFKIYTDNEEEDFDIPGTPRKLNISIKKPDTVELNWMHPLVGATNVMSYVISYRKKDLDPDTEPSDTPKWISMCTRDASTTYTIDGLDQGTEYTFLVYAQCKIGPCESCIKDKKL